jgi:hypothetical protein
MTTPTVSKRKEGETKDEDFETQFRDFTAKHIGKVILTAFFLCGFLWSAFQIPQLDKLQKENVALQNRIEKNETFVIIIEKYSARILDITKNENEKEIWREMLQEIKDAKNSAENKQNK